MHASGEKERRGKLRAYVRSGHRKVRGFVTEGAMQLLLAVDVEQRGLNVRGHVAEIGVHQGSSFILLALLRRPGEQALAVDLFDLQEFNVDESGRGHRALFLANVARHAGSTEGIHLIEADSTRLASSDLMEPAGGQFRLFHVDGGHTQQIARHDVETAVGALAEGGVVVVDDYFHELWPGVSDGVRAFLAAHPEAELAPFAIGGGKVFFARRKWSARYREALRSLRVEGYAKESVMLGEPVLCFAFWHMGPKDRFIRSRLWKRMRSCRPVVMARNVIRRREGRDLVRAADERRERAAAAAIRPDGR